MKKISEIDIQCYTHSKRKLLKWQKNFTINSIPVILEIRLLNYIHQTIKRGIEDLRISPSRVNIKPKIRTQID